MTDDFETLRGGLGIGPYQVCSNDDPLPILCEGQIRSLLCGKRTNSGF